MSGSHQRIHSESGLLHKQWRGTDRVVDPVVALYSKEQHRVFRVLSENCTSEFQAYPTESHDKELETVVSGNIFMTLLVLLCQG